ncbi:MAG: hypothetical protein KF901_20380 [Myxococcales bacterium]|nr:hypothetical protein [Myxococcales bacterium]
MAQDADSAPAREAARAFREGTAAADELRWRDAERAFAHAFEVSGLPHALYMQGVALRALDRVVEARDTMLRVIALLERDPDTLAGNADIHSEARSLAAQSEARISRLEISPVDPGASLRVDGRAHAITGRRVVVEVDPGTRSVIVEREGFDTFVWTGEAIPGTRTTVEVMQTALGASIGLESRPHRRRRTIIATLVSAVLVGAGVFLAVRFARSPTSVSPQFPERLFEVP